MARRKEKPGFDDWYEALYGERWPALKEALLQKPTYYTLSRNLKKTYHMDGASVIAAEALGTEPGEKILDMCAAPGGKTLVLATALDGKGELTANDRSSARRARLHRVLDEHLPDSLRAAVTVTGHDASRWGLYEQEVYDRVFLDAPCSSERHILNSPAHLEKWSPARTRHLAAQAYAMLASAYLSVKPGGTILYCTCALSPLENDGVVERLLKKKPVTADPPSVDIGESTQYGIQIFPDSAGGKGPIYLSRIFRDK